MALQWAKLVRWNKEEVVFKLPALAPLRPYLLRLSLEQASAEQTEEYSEQAFQQRQDGILSLSPSLPLPLFLSDIFRFVFLVCVLNNN